MILLFLFVDGDVQQKKFLQMVCDELDFLDKIQELRADDVKIERGIVYVILSGLILPGKRFKKVLHEPFVGSWWYGGGEKLFADDNLWTGDQHEDKVTTESIGLHERVELWLKQKFFPNTPLKDCYVLIHPIAESIEKEWHIRTYGKESWIRYSNLVKRVFDLEMKYALVH